MAKELKIWLKNEKSIVAQIKALDGRYLNRSKSIHTYFKQPSGQVLKLVEANGKLTLDKLKKEGQQFVFVNSKPVDNKRALRKELTGIYGVKKKLIMHAKNYQVQDYNVGLYDIKGVGRFLILTGANPTTKMLQKWFNLKSPEVVKDSFDNL